MIMGNLMIKNIIIFCSCLWCFSTAIAFADDLQIFGGNTATVQPNVLIIFDNSGSMGSRGTGTGIKSKLDVAKEEIGKLITGTSGVRFGLMVFNRNNEGGHIVQPCGASQSDLVSSIDGLGADTYTPLAETLSEAGLYFAGMGSWFNTYSASSAWYNNTTKKYISPMQYDCQKNYIIIMTDGAPTEDRHTNLTSANYINGDRIGDHDGDGRDPGSYGTNGSDYLDDVAHYLYNNDCNQRGTAGSRYERQNITVYTVGFDVDNQLLADTATNGGGEYYTASNSSALSAAFNSIIQSIQKTTVTYTPPVIPRDPNNRYEVDNKVYYPLFRPDLEGRWIGNLKAFNLINNPSTGLLTIMDNSSPPVAATDAQGVFLDTAKSFWSNAADGIKVDFGGAGEVLANRTTARNIYTFIDTDPGHNVNLVHPNNKFTATSTNPFVTQTVLAATSTTERDNIINQTLAGMSITRDDGTTVTWKMGDIVHSEPAVESYGVDINGNGTIDSSEWKSYLFVGANDGMLHVFDADNGSESWAFIPPGQLPRLKLLTDSTHDYYVDGSPVVEDVMISNEKKKLLFFGERRGGKRYYALDITSPLAPVWKYQINEGVLTSLDGDGNGSVDGSAATLGQSWAKPQFVKVKLHNEIKDAFLLTGGYDNNQDATTPSANDNYGRAIYTIRADTGSVFGLNLNGGNWSAMTNAILEVNGFSASRLGYIDRVYAGDLGGKVFAARYKGCTDRECTNDYWEKMVLLDLPATLTPPTGTTVNLGQKFMQRPTATLYEKCAQGECIYAGTGDREHLFDTSKVDVFYKMCNRWEKDENGVLQSLTLDDLVDVTDNLVQLGTDEQKVFINNALNSGNGWYIRMPNPGEKIVSKARVIDGKIYFTTFTPGNSSVSVSDPCAVSFDYGVARLYILDACNGGAVYGTERSVIIGTSVPSDPVVFSSGGKMYISVGGMRGDAAGGKVDKLGNLKEPEQYYWRQLK